MMDPAGLKSKMKERIYNGLKTQFGSAAGQGQGYTPIADAHWEKLAESISGIAIDIVMEITQNAQVAPGIGVVGVGGGVPGPVSGSTITPGVIS